MKRLVVVLVPVVVIVAGSLAALALAEAPAPRTANALDAGCSAPLPPAEIDTSFHQIGNMRDTAAAHPPLASLPGRRLSVAAESSAIHTAAWTSVVPAGMALQAVFDADAATGLGLRLYYANSPLGSDERIEDLLARGGISLEITPTAGIDGPYVMSQVGSRGMKVSIGGQSATLVHSDEIRPGLRPYNLYWSDGTYDFAIQGGGDATSVLTLAASMYC